MDGLDSRGQIIVIGATNRPDAIDPALRRPGRFDRELCFNLPSKKARKQILKIHTKSWDTTSFKLDEELLNYLSEQSVGYCGADLEALCREAFLAAVRRTYPQIYHSNVRLQIDTQQLQVVKDDFEKALKDITPSSQRSSLVYARPIPDLLKPLLFRQLSAIKADIQEIFSLKKQDHDDDNDNEAVQEQQNEDENNNHSNTNQHHHKRVCNEHYRYLIHGEDDRNGQNYLGPAVLHLMEEYPLYSLDFAGLYGDSSTKCADEAILRIFKEAQNNSPSVIYWPHIDRFWSSAHDILKTSISLLISDISKDTPILIIATANIGMEHLDNDLLAIFEKYSFYDCNQSISDDERRRFWQQLTVLMTEKPKHRKKTIEQYPTLPIAELPKNAVLEQTTQKQNESNKEAEWYEAEKMAIVNLRVYIRSVCNRLCKHFKNFIDEMSEDGVCKNDLSLFAIRQRNNERPIPTAIEFLEDIDSLVQNVRNSAQSNSLKARQFVNESCNLQDQALSMMAQVNRDLVKMCDKLKEQSESKKRVRFGSNDANENQPENNASKKRKSSLRNANKNKQSDKEENDDDEDEEMEIVHDENVNNLRMSVVENDDDDDEEREIQIDERKMDGMIDKLVKVTKNYVVDEMEEKMYSLLRIIYRHSNEWNKNVMLSELNQHIQHYFKAKR